MLTTTSQYLLFLLGVVYPNNEKMFVQAHQGSCMGVETKSLLISYMKMKINFPFFTISVPSKTYNFKF